MAAPLYSNIITGLTSQIDTLTNNFVHQGYNALMAALRAPLAALCILFIVLTGFGILRGLIKAPLEALVSFSIRLGIIYLVGLNWDFFAQNIMALFVDGIGGLGSVLMKSTGLTGFSRSQPVMSGLQGAFNEVIRAGAFVAKHATFRHPAPLLSSALIYTSGLIVTGMALRELIIAKLMMSLCLVTAPLFIIMTLFDKTRAFFDRWLGLLAGFSLVLVFVSAVVSLCLSLIHWTMGGYADNASAELVSVSWIPIFLVSCFCVMVLSEAAHMAKAIGGACHTAGASAMVGAFMGGAMGSARTLKRGFSRLRKNNHSSSSSFSNRDTQSGAPNVNRYLRGEA